jgi:hypothetical protein
MQERISRVLGVVLAGMASGVWAAGTEPEVKSSAPPPVFVRGDKAEVDYAALCAENDVVYLQPALYPFEGMFVGNGNLGVCVWNSTGRPEVFEGGVTFKFGNGCYRYYDGLSSGRYDPSKDRLSGNCAVSSGKIMLTAPGLDDTAPVRFEHRLTLWDGTITTHVEGTDRVLSLVAEALRSDER